MAKTRVVILDDHITPYRIPLFRGLAGSESLDLTVLYCTRQLPDRKWRQPNDLDYRSMILNNYLLRFSRPPYNEPRYVLINPTLIAELRRLRPDVVVAYAFSVPSWQAFVYSRVSGCKFISWSTDTLHTERYLGVIQRSIRHFLIPRSDACITPSTQGQIRYERYGARKEAIFRTPQAADVHWFVRETTRLKEQSETYKDKHGLRGPITLYVGSVSHRKGVHALLNVFNLVLQRKLPGTLLIVGEGNMRSHLEAEAASLGISSSVEFIGFVDYSQLPEFYASADLFAFPTLEDTFGVVLAEAAASGLPIVASKFAGAALDFVIEGKNGFVIDPSDREQFAQALIYLIGDLSRARQMGNRSQELAEKNGLEASVVSFEEAIRFTANKRSR